MSKLTTHDGTEIYYRDWGAGQPVVFSHGWPLTGDAWGVRASLPMATIWIPMLTTWRSSSNRST